MTDLLRCSDVAEKLPLFVGGDLEPDGLEAVRGHLARCERCVEELQVASSARTALLGALQAGEGATAHGEGGLDLWPGIRAALEREGRLGASAQRSRPVPPTPSMAPGPLRGRAPLLSFRRPRAVAAAAALLLTLGPLALWSSWGPWAIGGRGAGAPSGPAPADVVVSGPAAPGGVPLLASEAAPAAGRLRRVLPGEEALADTAASVPQTLVPVPNPSPGSPWAPWSNPTTVAGYR